MTFGAPSTKETTPVQVALRVRPLTFQDRAQPRFSQSTESNVIKAIDNTVVVVPQQKSFTFDHVFGTDSTQEQVFESVASGLVDRFVDGYNVTILAYGQTSSGKTYTMGTEVGDQADPKHQGIIPRAMTAIFDQLSTETTTTTTTTTPMPTTTTTTTPLPAKPKQRPSSLLQPVKGSGNSNNKRSMVAMRPNFMNKSKSSISSSAPFSQQIVNVVPEVLGHPQQRKRYTVKVSFIEIYNEELIDLLNPVPPSERPPVTIREDPKGKIYWTGVREVPVESAEDVLRYLQIGTRNRATGSTDMNAKSSRSHAIFSVTLWQEKWVSTPKASMSTTVQQPPHDTPTHISSRSSMPGVPRRRPSGVCVRSVTQEHQQLDMNGDGKWVVSNSKFHFVDLAGSERLKRTAAEGDRRKEGININAGLLALGNVISALADAGVSRRMAVGHIPYRDSKLTRLLQDSLGGNATTLMIACISPAEINLVETVNTVKYAYRARHIKNKVERNEAEEWMTNDNPEFLRGMITKLKDQVRVLRTSSTLAMPAPPSPRTPSFSTDTSTTPTCSSSATTNITMPDDLDVIIDLRRQIEKLQRQVHEKREIEPSLATATDDDDDKEFQHLVEPVIEEYEKSVSSLESQLALARAALAHQDQALQDQAAQLASLQKNQQLELARRDVDNSCVLGIQQEAEQLRAESAQRQATIIHLQEAIGSMKEQEQDLRDAMEKKEHAFMNVLAEKEDLFRHQLKQQQKSFREELLRQESSFQSVVQRQEEEAYRWRLEDLEMANKHVMTLQQIQEKQDQIINGLGVKMRAMETVIFELNQQLAERGQHIAELNCALSSLHADREVLQEQTQHLVESLEKQQTDMARTAAALNELKSTASDQVRHVSEKLVEAHEAALAQLQAEHTLAIETLQAELAETRHQNKDQSQMIGALEISLEAMQIHLDEAATCDDDERAVKVQSAQDQVTSWRRLTVDTDSSHDSGLPDNDFDDDNDSGNRPIAMLREGFRTSMTMEQMLDKLMQMMAENSAFSVKVKDLESQLELQRNQHKLENKHLELKMMKLSAANERLEKAATSIPPRSLSGHELEQNTSPPQTPRPNPISLFLPLRPSSLPPQQQQQQFKDQKLLERNSWSLFSLKKSGSQRSTLTNQPRPGDDIIAGVSASAAVGVNAAMIRRVRAQSAAIEAPPSAPPSNPLPPVPPPARSFSTPLLTSTTTTTTTTTTDRMLSISDVISSRLSGHFSAEQYEKIIRSLQRKVQMADEDVLEHQQVISKLEMQLSRSEDSVRHVRQQLETAEQEKQTYALEIEHLRAHEAEHDQQEQQLLQDLAQERILKDKAEKARHILEHRMEEILCNSKRSKFICF